MQVLGVGDSARLKPCVVVPWSGDHLLYPVQDGGRQVVEVFFHVYQPSWDWLWVIWQELLGSFSCRLVSLQEWEIFSSQHLLCGSDSVRKSCCVSAQSCTPFLHHLNLLHLFLPHYTKPCLLVLFEKLWEHWEHVLDLPLSVLALNFNVFGCLIKVSFNVFKNLQFLLCRLQEFPEYLSVIPSCFSDGSDGAADVWIWVQTDDTNWLLMVQTEEFEFLCMWTAQSYRTCWKSLSSLQ